MIIEVLVFNPKKSWDGVPNPTPAASLVDICFDKLKQWCDKAGATISRITFLLTHYTDDNEECILGTVINFQNIDVHDRPYSELFLKLVPNDDWGWCYEVQDMYTSKGQINPDAYEKAIQRELEWLVDYEGLD